MALALSLVLGSLPLAAETPGSAAPDASDAAAAAPMTAEELQTLVAPIALYPDPLVSQVLVASTYPLEVVEAGQWLEKHPDLKGQALKDAAARQSWDPSVQALVLFPDVIKRLNDDISWTTKLGDAFLADQSGVMDSIQTMRGKAADTGKLKSTDQEKVTTVTEDGKTVVRIEPARPEVIYVPVYDPAWIWGPPPYGYSYVVWGYPPPPPVGVWFYWGPAFRMTYYYPRWGYYGGWGWWGWRPWWRDRVVIVNRTFIVHNHYNVVQVERVHDRTVWVHSPEHRRGVHYPNRRLEERYHSAGGARPMERARPTPEAVQRQFHRREQVPNRAERRERPANPAVRHPNAVHQKNRAVRQPGAVKPGQRRWKGKVKKERRSEDREMRHERERY